MSKLFKRFSGITLGLALCFGFSFSCSNKQSSNQMARAEGASLTSVTGSTTSAKITYNSVEYNGYKIGSSKATGTVGFTVPSGSTECSFYAAGWSNKAVVLSLTISSGNISSSTEDITSHTNVSGSGSTFEITGNDGDYLHTFTLSDVAASATVNITTASSSGDKRAVIWNASYSSGGGSATKLGTPNVQFDKTNKQVTWGAIDNASSYTLVVDGGTPVENATSPYSVNTLATGTSHTVTVTAIGDGTNYTNSSSGSVTFSFLEHAGTADDPYTVADARAAIDANDGITDVYATGIVSKIVKEFNAQYGDISYNISSDGTTSSPQLEAYQGKGIGGANFTSADDIQIGDVVVVKGNLTKYNSTYEFASNNQLVSLTRPQAPALQYLEMSGVPVSEYKTTDTSWDPTGLKIDAYYDNNTSKDVTSLVTWSYDLGSPNEVGVGDYCVSFIASYQGESVSDDFNVSVAELAIVNTYNLGGDYHIYVANASNNSDGAWINDGSTKNSKGAPYGTDKEFKAGIYKLSLVEDNTFTITLGSNYLYSISDNNGIRLDNNPNDESEKWVVSKSGDYYLFKNKLRNTRYLSYYSSNNDIRSYANTATANVTLSIPKQITGFSVYSEGANKDVLKGTTFDAISAAEAGFEPRINYIDGSYETITEGVTWTLETSIVTNNATLIVSYPGYDDVEIDGMNIYAPAIVSLSIDTTNVKTSYFVGDALDVSGAVIKGYDANNEEYNLEISQCTFSPSNGDVLSVSDTTVTVTYINDDNSPAAGTYNITVSIFTGFTKVTSADDLEVGASYVIGAESHLMGAVSSDIRSVVDASGVMSTDGNRVGSQAPTMVGASVVTLLSDGNGKYAFYDMSSEHFIVGSDSNKLLNADTLSEDSWWTIDFANDSMSVNWKDTTRVFAYNENNNNLRIATYKSYSNTIVHPVLFKMDGSSIKDSVEEFANAYLKMNNSDYEGDISTPYCETNYNDMKEGYAVLLSEAEKNVFQYADDFAAARARLNAWATANGEVFTYGNASPFEALRKTNVNGNILSPEDDSSLIILFIICTLGAGALSAFYLMKKKKRA